MTDTLSAYHEAGHAVVSLLLGEMPEMASIRTAENGSTGHVDYLAVEARAIAAAAVRGATTEADKARVMAYLISNAAGPAAQALKMRRGVRIGFFDQTSWEMFDGGADFKRSKLVAAKAHGLTASHDDIVEEAFDMLERPEVWAAVERVAKDLLRFGELNYEGIRDATLYPLEGVRDGS